MDSANSLRMVPTAAFAGFVAPEALDQALAYAANGRSLCTV